MPAAAVIPAPIAYTKVVAVKKLVVEFLVVKGGPAFRVVYLPFTPILVVNMYSFY